MNWYLAVLKNYVGFDGRARRTEYWMFVLINAVIGLALYLLAQVADVFLILYYLYALAVLLPGLAVAVRRLHDTGRSGWWLLLSFIPIVGAIILIVFLATDGQPGSNAHGPNPKEVAPHV